ncbi:MAG: glycosyltransferase [Actinomycetota bacterium]
MRVEGLAEAGLADAVRQLRAIRPAMTETGVVELVGVAPAASSRWAHLAGLDVADDGSGMVLRRPAVRADEPLVSVLVPAYRTDFLDEALASASGQTWEQLEILIGDDAPGDEVRALVEPWLARDRRIRYLGRPDERGEGGNFRFLLSQAGGDYVKVLNDDDLLHPEAVRRMATTLNAHPDVTLVTSHRARIDEVGRPLGDAWATTRRVAHDAILRGDEAAAEVLRSGTNWIGEPTTTMFRRADLRGDHPFVLFDRPLRASADVAMWLKLLGRGDLVYLVASLSSFRQHSGQSQLDPEFRERCARELQEILDDARRIGFDDRPPFQPADLGDPPWWAPETLRAVRDLTDDADPAEVEAIAGLDPVEAALLKAQLHLGRGTPGPAAAELAELCRRPDCSPPVHKFRALALAELGEIEQAIGALRQAHDLCPTDPEPNALLRSIVERGEPARTPIETETAAEPHDVTRPAAIEPPAVAIGALVLSDGQLAEAVVTATGLRPFADRVTVVERQASGSSYAPVGIDDIDLVEHDWFDGLDRVVGRLGRGWGIVVGAGEQIWCPRPDVLRSELATTAAARVVLGSDVDLDRALVRCSGEGSGAASTTTAKVVSSGVDAAGTVTAQRWCPVCEAPGSFRPLPAKFVLEARLAGFAHPTDGWELMNDREYECAACGASDRDRLTWLFLEHHLATSGRPPATVEIAPSPALSPRLRRRLGGSYRSGDLLRRDVDDVVDLCDLPYGDGEIDLLICSHVLEHVPDDRRAMAEIGRVLSPGGVGVLLVPISLVVDGVDEDPSVVAPADRLARFGQDDHVRTYSAEGFVERLRSTGLSVETFGAGQVGERLLERAAIPTSGRLYLVRST